MKCSAYIATSVDGFIAKPDGSVDWLQSAGDPDAGPQDENYVDFNSYLASVDCMIMGRKCMDVISGFNLTPDQWPYGATRIIVLSRTITGPPQNLVGKVEIHSGDLNDLVTGLEGEGYRHAYIDGGATIRAFLALGLIDELTITQIPVLLGDGIPLFGSIGHQIPLRAGRVVAGPNGTVQYRYKIGQGNG